MNDTQKGVLIAWALAFAAMGIYPPWMQELAQRPYDQGAQPVIGAVAVHHSVSGWDGYDWIFSAGRGYYINVSRLCVQWIVLTVLCGTWFYLAKESSPPGGSSPSRPT